MTRTYKTRSTEELYAAHLSAMQARRAVVVAREKKRKARAKAKRETAAVRAKRHAEYPVRKKANDAESYAVRTFERFCRQRETPIPWYEDLKWAEQNGGPLGTDLGGTLSQSFEVRL